MTLTTLGLNFFAWISLSMGTWFQFWIGQNCIGKMHCSCIGTVCVSMEVLCLKDEYLCFEYLHSPKLNIDQSHINFVWTTKGRAAGGMLTFQIDLLQEPGNFLFLPIIYKPVTIFKIFLWHYSRMWQHRKLKGQVYETNVFWQEIVLIANTTFYKNVEKLSENSADWSWCAVSTTSTFYCL